MARVTRDARDGRWLARWRDPAGRQRKKWFDRKGDAQRWLDQLRAEMHSGHCIDPSAAKAAFGPFAEQSAEGLPHLKGLDGESLSRHRPAPHRSQVGNVASREDLQERRHRLDCRSRK